MNLAGAVEDLLEDDLFKIFVNSHLWAGLALSLIYFGHLILPLFKRPYKYIVVRLNKNKRSALATRIIEDQFDTADAIQSTRLKEACSWKMKAMLSDAVSMHTKEFERQSTTKKSEGKGGGSRAMENYVLHGEQTTLSGGVLWCIKEIIMEGLHFSHGIVLPSRMYIFQTIQTIVALLIFWFVLINIDTVAEAADDAKADLPEGLPQWYYDMM